MTDNIEKELPSQELNNVTLLRQSDEAEPYHLPQAAGAEHLVGRSSAELHLVEEAKRPKTRSQLAAIGRHPSSQTAEIIKFPKPKDSVLNPEFTQAFKDVLSAGRARRVSQYRTFANHMGWNLKTSKHGLSGARAKSASPEILAAFSVFDEEIPEIYEKPQKHKELYNKCIERIQNNNPQDAEKGVAAIEELRDKGRNYEAGATCLAFIWAAQIDASGAREDIWETEF